MFEIFYNFLGLNQQLFLLINEKTNHSIVPQILQLISWFFSITNFVFYYAIACTYLYTRLRKIKEFPKASQQFWDWYHKMVEIGVIYTVFSFTYALLKFSINLPRPFCSLPKNSFHTIANIVHERCLSSFPSAHTGLAFLIFYFIWPYLDRTQKLFAAIIIFLVAISRLSLAMHYPADILYSFLVAIIVIMIGKRLFQIFKTNLIDAIGKLLMNCIL